MTIAISAQRLRFACVKDSHTPMLDLVTNGPAKIWRGTDITIELGLFVGAALIDTVAPIATLYLEIHRPRGSYPLVQKSVAGASIVTTVTQETWTNSSAQNASINLTAAETQFDLGDNIQGTAEFWLVVHIVDTTGKKITWSVANLTVEEDGAQNDMAVVPMSNQDFRIKNGNLQLWNPVQDKWHTFYPTGPSGQETTAWGPGED